MGVGSGGGWHRRGVAGAGGGAVGGAPAGGGRSGRWGGGRWGGGGWGGGVGEGYHPLPANAQALGTRLILQAVRTPHSGWADARRPGISAPTPAPPGLPKHAEDRQWRDDGSKLLILPALSRVTWCRRLSAAALMSLRGVLVPLTAGAGVSYSAWPAAIALAPAASRLHLNAHPGHPTTSHSRTWSFKAATHAGS